MPSNFFGRKIMPTITGKAVEAGKRWFRQKFKKVTTVKGKTRPVGRPNIGKMYAYVYDPKHKKTLPLYDTQPLVIPIEMYSDGFLGLNFHYLPITQRYALLSALDKVATGDLTNIKDRHIISYQILKRIAKHKLFAPTIHRYLYKHIRTPLATVHPQEWKVALALPTAKFKKGRPY